MEKIKISAAQFDKEVEKEYCHLVYIDRMKQEKAQLHARQTVEAKYEIIN